MLKIFAHYFILLDMSNFLWARALSGFIEFVFAMQATKGNESNEQADNSCHKRKDLIINQNLSSKLLRICQYLVSFITAFSSSGSWSRQKNRKDYEWSRKKKTW